ncbi:MAG TPA: alpha/beta fold hydrolase [Pseudonocardia sp.]|uniref:alpha/beta hydrolase n=1 Tax=Pseudonocardia sp. TaxID=60912 RepID=UPI002C21677F|nr:alpha/beta fold hydrolase [Pseudonocardia sp.]HTF46766.1 alpha/beta fold hydrolase [Pseudonocardia sp.]
MARTVLVLVAVALLMLALLWAVQRRIIYLPAGHPGPASVAGPTAREVTVPTEDGLELGAWLVGPTGPDRGVHVLFASGNAGHRGYRVGLAQRLAAEGFSVLLLDYRGFGGNPGSPSEQGLAQDVRAARRFLLEHAGARPDRLIYFGESLGGAVVTGLAVEHPPAGLLLRSPFRDLASVGQLHYPFLPVRLMLRDRLDVVGPIQRVRAPTIVVYGGADRVVPPEQSEAVAAAAPGLVRTLRLPGADHNDPVLLDGDEIIAAVVDLSPTS